MKKRKLLSSALLLLTVLGLAGCGPSTASSDEPDEEKDYTIEVTEDIQDIVEQGYLTVGVKTDVPGLGYYEQETETYSGLEIELACQIAGKLFEVEPEQAMEDGLVRFEPVTVENREDKLEAGEVDLLLATYTITAERQEIFAFSEPYYSDYIGIMVKKEQTDKNSLGSRGITSVQKLDGKKVGVAKDADTRDHMLRYFRQRSYNISPYFMEYAGYEQLYRALKEGSIDAFAVDVSILNGYVDDTLVILPDRFAQQQYGAAAVQERQGLIDAVNVVIEEYGY